MPRIAKHLSAAFVFLWSLSAHMTIWGQTAPEPKVMPREELKAFAASYDVLMSSYVTPLNGGDVIKGAIRGMARELDPEGGEYWTEEEFREFRDGAPPGSGSIGTELRRRDAAWLLSPLAGSPALEAGVRFGDQLRTIDGASVSTSSALQATRLFRGTVGTEVILGVYRPSEDRTLTLTVKRRLVQYPAASLSILPDGFRLLKVPSLNAPRLDAAFVLLRDAWASAKFSGLILDMRGNQGGEVESAVALAAAFLPKDSVVASMAGRSAKDNRTFRASPSDYQRGVSKDPMAVLPEDLRRLPLVVLVDGQTASGAEIIVAAWRDAGRAKIVGRPTYGRGSIQTVTPITGLGAIKYTSGYWVSPSGFSFDHSPIQPDRVVDSSDDSAHVAAALELLRNPRVLDAARTPGCPDWARTFQATGFPRAASAAGLSQGQVTVEFTLNTDGSAHDARIVRTTNQLFDAETLERTGRLKCVGSDSPRRVRFTVDYRLQE